MDLGTTDFNNSSFGQWGCLASLIDSCREVNLGFVELVLPPLAVRCLAQYSW